MDLTKNQILAIGVAVLVVACAVTGVLYNAADQSNKAAKEAQATADSALRAYYDLYEKEEQDIEKLRTDMLKIKTDLEAAVKAAQDAANAAKAAADAAMEAAEAAQGDATKANETAQQAVAKADAAQAAADALKETLQNHEDRIKALEAKP